jgi:serine/threonine-protein kinase
LVYAAGGALLAIPFDLGALKTVGTAVTVVPRVESRLVRNFDVAADGTIVYVDEPETTSSAERTLVWVDRRSVETVLNAPPRPYRHPRLSPDGKRVAVAIADQADAIWVWDLVAETLRQTTFGRGGDFGPMWTTDGHRLIFRRTAGLFWQRADGRGAAERLGTGIPTGITPNGKQVLITSSPGATDVMVLELGGTSPVEPLIQTPKIERNAVVSPNGRWLAYDSDSEGQFEIFVVPFPNVSAGLSKVSTAGGTRPLWSPNGSELFYVAPDGAVMAARVESRDAAWSAGSPAKIVEGPYATGQPFGSRNYDVSIDGQRFLMVKEPANRSAPPQIIVVQNWKGLVPMAAARNEVR